MSFWMRIGRSTAASLGIPDRKGRSFVSTGYDPLWLRTAEGGIVVDFDLNGITAEAEEVILLYAALRKTALH